MKKLVLIADDSEEVRKTLALALKEHNFATLQAENGSEVFNLLPLHKIDCLIIDLVMPGKEGIETIRQVMKSYPDVKIIAISGYDNYLRIAESFYITGAFKKPLNLEALLDSLN